MSPQGGFRIGCTLGIAFAVVVGAFSVLPGLLWYSSFPVALVLGYVLSRIDELLASQQGESR